MRVSIFQSQTFFLISWYCCCSNSSWWPFFNPTPKKNMFILFYVLTSCFCCNFSLVLIVSRQGKKIKIHQGNNIVKSELVSSRVSFLQYTILGCKNWLENSIFNVFFTIFRNKTNWFILQFNVMQSQQLLLAHKLIWTFNCDVGNVDKKHLFYLFPNQMCETLICVRDRIFIEFKMDNEFMVL